MKDLLKEILSSIPKYISSFAQVLSGPKTFIASRDMDQESALTEALTFVGISFCLVMILIAPLIPDSVDFWKHFGTQLLTTLILIVGMACILRLAWKIVGGQAPFNKFLILYSYYFGVMFPLMVLVMLCSEGVLKSFDPELYKKLVAIKLNQSTEPVNAFQSNAFIAALIVYLIGYGLVTVWAIIGWGAYRSLNNVSKARSFIAFCIAGYLTWPVLILYYFIQKVLSK